MLGEKIKGFVEQISSVKEIDQLLTILGKVFNELNGEAMCLRWESFNRKYYLISHWTEENPIQTSRILKRDLPDYIEKNDIQIHNLTEKDILIQVEEEDIPGATFYLKWADGEQIEDLSITFLVHVLQLKLKEIQLTNCVSKYDQMLSNSLDVLMMIEKNEVEYVSPQSTIFTGTDITNLNQQVITNMFLNPKDSKDVTKKIQEDKRLRRGSSLREYQLKHSDGSFRWIEWVTRRIFDENGEIERLILNFRDVTDKKNAEKELASQKEFLQDVLDSLPIDIFMKDKRGEYIFINDSACKSIHKEKSEVIGKKDDEIFSKEIAEIYKKSDKQVMEGDISSLIHSTIQKGIKKTFLSKKLPLKLHGEDVLLSYSVDITEQKNVEERLRDSSYLINGSLQIIPDSIFVFDLVNFDYVFTNNKIFNKLGFKNTARGAELKKFIKSLMHPEDVEKFLAQYDEIRQGLEAIYEMEYRVFDKDGNMHWMYSRKAPIKRNNDGLVDQFVGITSDITEQKRKEEKILSTQKELRKAVETRDEFLSVISHEIRTPLNAIIGIANLLGKVGEPEEKEDLVNVLRNSGENLLFMINNILDFSKIRSGNMVLDKREFSINQLLENLYASHKPATLENNIKLEFKKDNKIPEALIGDPVRLNQVLSNLIANAIKFTDVGKVQIKAALIEENEKSVKLSFEISDTGIGIAPKDQKEIFKPFQQVNYTLNRKQGGTGLGLSITKQLIDVLGGKLELESELNKGSTFRFELLFEQVKRGNKNLKGGAQVEQEIDLKDIKLLYVEDVSSNRFLMEAYCKLWNIDLRTVETGNEAVEMLKKEKYDLILLDLHMPDMNGFEAFDLFKATVDNLPPVIAISADISESTEQKIAESGLQGFVSKPVDFDDLNRRMKNLIPQKIKSLNDGEEELRTIKEIYKYDYQEYMQYLNSVIDELNTYSQELQEALKKEDHVAFRQTRHKLLGPLGIFNQEGLIDLLNEVSDFFPSDKKGNPKEHIRRKITSDFLRLTSVIREEISQFASS